MLYIKEFDEENWDWRYNSCENFIRKSKKQKFTEIRKY